MGSRELTKLSPIFSKSFVVDVFALGGRWTESVNMKALTLLSKKS